MALSLTPEGLRRSTESIMASTSSTDSTSGRYWPSFGKSTASQGLSLRSPSTMHQSKNAFRELSSLAWLRFEIFPARAAICSLMSSLHTSPGIREQAEKKPSTSPVYAAAVLAESLRSTLR